MLKIELNNSDISLLERRILAFAVTASTKEDLAQLDLLVELLRSISPGQVKAGYVQSDKAIVHILGPDEELLQHYKQVLFPDPETSTKP